MPRFPYLRVVSDYSDNRGDLETSNIRGRGRDHSVQMRIGVMRDPSDDREHEAYEKDNDQCCPGLDSILHFGTAPFMKLVSPGRGLMPSFDAPHTVSLAKRSRVFFSHQPSVVHALEVAASD